MNFPSRGWAELRFASAEVSELWHLASLQLLVFREYSITDLLQLMYLALSLHIQILLSNFVHLPAFGFRPSFFFCNTSAHPCSQFCQNVSLVPELFLACRVAHNLCGKDVRDAIIRYKASLAQNFFKIKPITIFMRSELRMPYRVQLITNSLL